MKSSEIREIPLSELPERIEGERIRLHRNDACCNTFRESDGNKSLSPYNCSYAYHLF